MYTKESAVGFFVDAPGLSRPLRPLFPAGYHNEVQIMGAVLSADKENDPDILCMIGASGALHVSNIPFLKPTAAVRVARRAGRPVGDRSGSDVRRARSDV